MADKRKALGRGLRALIPEPVAPLRREPAQEVDLDLLRPNREQPRGAIEDARLAELAESVRAHGIIQPLVVTRQEDGTFEIVAGERRWRAAQRAGLLRVPVVERTVASSKRLELALIENIQREDLNAIETAAAYARLADEFGFTQEADRPLGRQGPGDGRQLPAPAAAPGRGPRGGGLGRALDGARARPGRPRRRARPARDRPRGARAGPVGPGDRGARQAAHGAAGARPRRRRPPTCTRARPRIASRWPSGPGSASSAGASAAASRSRSSPRTSSSACTSDSPATDGTGPRCHSPARNLAWVPLPAPAPPERFRVAPGPRGGRLAGASGGMV